MPARREVAAGARAHHVAAVPALLVPLMYDPAREVAEEAIRSAGRLGASDYLFVPPLLSLLRNRLLKGPAREVLVGYGDDIVETLAFFLRDESEDIWVRRHIPSTLALIPTQQSVDVLVSALDAPDGFLRYKALRALGRLKREHPELSIPTRADRSARGQGDEPVLQLPGPPLQPRRQGSGRAATRCWRARSRRSSVARWTASTTCSR